MTQTNEQAPQWQHMSVGELEREYSPSSAVGGNYQPFIKDYSRLSKGARARCKRIETVKYGPRPSNTIDIALPENTDQSASGSACPLLVFFHGGYWQEGSKTDSFFGADVFIEQGIAYGAVAYTLAPEVTLAQIIAECRLALDSIFSIAGTLGIDPDRIHIAGSSAGAHLCAMCCIDGGNVGPTAKNRIAGAILLSGVYEVEALIGTSVNDAVGLTRDDAKKVSPQLLSTMHFPRTIITWGEVETDEFKRQSGAFAGKLTALNRDVQYFETPTRNHFDIVHDIANADSRLGLSVLNMINKD